MRQLLPGLLLLCLMLSGCSILDRSWVTVEEHSSKYWESEAASTLRAENYSDIVNDLLILIGRHTESATLRLYTDQDDLSVKDTLDRAATEVQQETPMGAYAVEYITCTSRAQRSCYEIGIQISYRRTLEQIQSVVNATSTAALPNLLQTALDAGQSELAVRIGYWTGDDTVIESMAAQVREERGLTEAPSWAVAFYPYVGTVGLIEFIFAPDAALLGEVSIEGAIPSGETPQDGEITPKSGDAPPSEEPAVPSEETPQSETGTEPGETVENPEAVLEEPEPLPPAVIRIN